MHHIIMIRNRKSTVGKLHSINFNVEIEKNYSVHVYHK